MVKRSAASSVVRIASNSGTSGGVAPASGCRYPDTALRKASMRPGEASRTSPRPAASISAAEHFRQGTDLYNGGQYREALGHFQAAHRLAPHPSNLFNMARCHENLTELADALARYREAASAYDRAARNLGGAGSSQAGYLAAFIRFRQLGEAGAALSSLDAVGADRPGSPMGERALALRARALNSLGRGEEARQGRRPT